MDIGFEITHNGNVHLIRCSNEELLFSKGKEERSRLFRHLLDTELVFTKDNFHVLRDIKVGAYRCEKAIVRVLWKGDEVLRGYFGMKSGKWSDYKCQVSIKLRVEDDYTCIKQYEKKSINILQGTNPYEIKTFVGVLETATNFVDRNDFFLSSPSTFISPPAGSGWVALSFKFTNLVQNPGLPTYAGRLTAEWVRVNTGGTYSSPRIALNESLSDTDADDGTYSQIYELVGGASGSVPNARRLEDVLGKYLSMCSNLSIKSDFFGINAVGDAPNNEAYQYASQYLHHLLINGKSDLRRPTAIQKQQILSYTFENFLRELSYLYDVYFTIDNGFFVLEHSSYFNQSDNVILDLDQIPATKGRNEHEHEENQPLRREYSFMEEVSFQFMAESLEYYAACAGEDADTDDIQAGSTNNDVEYIFGNKDRVSDSGMVFASTDLVSNQFVYTRKEVTVGGTQFINGALSWQNTIPALHLWEQYSDTIEWGTETLTAKSLKATKKLNPIEIPFSFSEWLSFSPNAGVVRFEDELYRVASANWSTKGKLTLNLER